MPAVKRALSDTTMTFRLPSATKRKFERAAELEGKSVTAFVVEAASASADDILFDQTHFVLSDSEWAKLQELLENPPEPNEKLKQLMRTKAPWE